MSNNNNQEYSTKKKEDSWSEVYDFQDLAINLFSLLKATLSVVCYVLYKSRLEKITRGRRTKNYKLTP